MAIWRNPIVSLGREAKVTIKAAEAAAAPKTFGRSLGEGADLRSVEEGK